MKRWILCITIFIVIPNLIKGQADKDEGEAKIIPRGYIGISGGPSFPLSDYGNNYKYNVQSGYAETGYNANAQIGYRLGRYYGLTAMFFTFSNPINENALKQDYSWLKVTELSASSWRCSGFQGGIYVSSPNKISFELHVMAGFSVCKSPELSMAFSDSSGSVIKAEQYAASATSLCFTIGPGIKIECSKTLSIFSYIDYFRSSPRLDNIISSVNGIIYHQDYTQSIKIINVNAGIAYNLK